MLNIEAVIFDMDGVLVNSEPHHLKIEKQMFHDLGLNITPEEHSEYMGTASDEMWQSIIERHSLSKSGAERLKMHNQRVISYFSSLKTLNPMPGLIPVLDKLQELKLPLAVASSSSAQVVDLVLNKSGLKSYFSVVVSGQMVKKSKPKPEIFLKAAARLKVEPTQCLVVEDSPNGIRAAIAAGMYCVAWRGEGFSHQDQSEADAVIADFWELMKMVPSN